MSGLETVLPVLWFGVIGFGVLMYVLLDGFVLGLGILAPFAQDGHQLDHMMNTAAPIWDGNETWLVLGGAGLLAAFPKAYALVLSTLYLPILLMLIALIFRGVAFEFRFKAHTSRWLWGVAFHVGSLLAAFAQGVILGALVDGIVAWGDEDAVLARVRAHLDAGADHVAVQVLTEGRRDIPLEGWRQLAPALRELAASRR